jgi:hypothetical protein
MESELNNNNKSSDSSSKSNLNLRERNNDSTQPRRTETLVPLNTQQKPPVVNNITNNNITNNTTSANSDSGSKQATKVSVEVKNNGGGVDMSQVVSELRALRGDLSRPTSNTSSPPVNSGGNSATVNVVQQTTPSPVMDASYRTSKSENITMNNISNRTG